MISGGLSFLSLTRLEHLIDELGDDGRDKLWVGVGEEGDGGHQRAAVEVHNVLQKGSISAHDLY